MFYSSTSYPVHSSPLGPSIKVTNYDLFCTFQYKIARFSIYILLFSSSFSHQFCWDELSIHCFYICSLVYPDPPRIKVPATVSAHIHHAMLNYNHLRPKHLAFGSVEIHLMENVHLFSSFTWLTVRWHAGLKFWFKPSNGCWCTYLQYHLTIEPWSHV